MRLIIFCTAKSIIARRLGGSERLFQSRLVRTAGAFLARLFLAVCHLKTRQWEAAKAGLSACVSQQPRFVWSYLLRSFANEKLHVPAEAEADLKRALTLNPNEDARYVLHSRTASFISTERLGVSG